MENIKIEYIPIKDLKPYEKNARHHEDYDISQIMVSIKKYGFNDPVGIWSDENIIVEGHGRVLAGKKLKMREVPCIRLDHLTDEERREYCLIHNKTAELSEWDFDLLAEDVPSLDFSDFDIDWGLPEDENDSDVEHISLTDKFVVPPFSVLDTRQGYWQDRKKAWKSLGIKSEEGRKENLTGAPDKTEYMNNGCMAVAVQTSIFDPVLAEIMYKWFNKKNGIIYDCFAGGSVRGIVASKLGYDYIGIDLRQEQVDANKEQAKEMQLNPVWYCDDSQNADKYIDDNSADLIFTCPPYADLEVYSDDERDISNMEYQDFQRVYKNILTIACRKLKDNRFCIIVIGDVRDKHGAYRNLVDYTKQCVNECGLKTYNEFILIEQIGTGALRAKHQFEGMRKAIKTHQNVLVFYKGDIKKIKDELGMLSIDSDLFGDV